MEVLKFSYFYLDNLFIKMKIIFTKKAAYKTLVMLFFSTQFLLLKAQVSYTPLTHITAFYMNQAGATCDGKIRIKFLFQENSQRHQLSNLTFYYRNKSNNWVEFATVINNSSKDLDWNESYWGASTQYSMDKANGSNLTLGSFTNDNNLRYIDFDWNNVPADAFGNGLITISSRGSFGPTSNWNEISSTSQINIPLPTLTPPGNFAATNGTHCAKVALSWSLPSSFPCSYRTYIYRENVEIANVAGTVTSFDDTATIQGPQTYYVKAIHKTTSTQGEISSVQSNTVVGARNASATLSNNISATATRCDGKILVSWSFSGTNPPNFKIYRDSSATGSFPEVAQVSGSSRTYLDAPPGREKTYYYKIGTIGTCGASITPGIFDGYAPDIPAKPSNVTATINTTTNRATVTWADNSNNETGFIIERTIQGASGSTQFNVDANITTYTDNTITTCQNYIYTVKSINNCAPLGNTAVTPSSPVRLLVNINTSFDNTTNILVASKGYFTNMVQLEWKTPNIDLLTSYRIFRKVYGSTSDSSLIGSVGQGQLLYTDNQAVSGVLYKYSVVGVLNCAGVILYSNVTEDIGFRSAFGTVSGKISYQGGTALQHAKVIASPSSASFIGTAISLPNGTANMQVPSGLTFDNGITAECWFNPTNISGTKDLIKFQSGIKSFTVRVINDKINLLANNGSSTRNLTGTTGFLANNYNQVTAVFAGDSMMIYLNGIRNAAVSLSGFTLLPLNNSSATIGNGFVGNVDEVRFYNRTKLQTEVTEDFSRRVDPDDDKLIAYYTFDENITGYNGFFDYSKVGTVFNENHGTMSGASFNSNIPSTSQLAFASFTDASGSFLITNIGYVGTGQIFNITPSFSTHSFTPSSRSVFIGDNSIVHNQIDFIDNSSFPCSGFVRYIPIGGAPSGCPAADINLYVDGVLQTTAGGAPVVTDANGAFNFEVPIGVHTVSVGKTGHVFSQGSFTNNFQNATAGIQFVDSTLIKVVGRAVGGPIEAAKKIGFGKSINNIGRTSITFKSQALGGCATLTRITNDTSGEYIAYLPPLIYTVDTPNIPSNPIVRFGVQSILDLRNAVNRTIERDTLRLANGTITRIDTFGYQARRDFIYYATPNLFFARKTNKTPTDTSMIGETSIVMDSATTIALVPNPFPYPIFMQLKVYTAKIYAYDLYVNRDGGGAGIIQQVPLNGSILVTNNLASLDSKTQVLDVVNGTADYSFRGGTPNLTTDPNPANSFTQTLSAVFSTTGANGERSVQWLPNAGGTPYRAYLFGGLAKGTNFITSGPQKVDFILRDPPGSGSSATWSKDSSYSTITRFSKLDNETGNLEVNINIGAKWGVSAGIFVEAETENEIVGSAGGGFEKTSAVGDNGELVTSISSSISISTGSGPDQVGHKADIFYGHSTNYTFGAMDAIRLIPQSKCGGTTPCGNVTASGYRIGRDIDLSLNPSGINTVFAYTTQEIEDIVIPNLVMVRNNIFKTARRRNGQLKYTNHYTDSSAEDFDQKFATNNDDPIWGTLRNNNPAYVQNPEDSTGPSYTYRRDSLYQIDSVRYYNNQIRIWKQALEQNEKEKYDAFVLNIGRVLSSATNTSIGKASITREFSNRTTDEKTRYEEIYLGGTFSAGFVALFGGSGIDLSGGFTMGETNISDNGTSIETGTTFSYTLTDGDDGDLITVDVVDPKTGNGHLFKLVGGQTTCPYEGEVWANYYRPGDSVNTATFYKKGESVKLANGTVQRHKPRIQVPQPFKFNVPANEAATFTLQLGNISGSNDDQDYDLRVVESSNPNGAVITIDGLDPNRTFKVPYGASFNKTLSVRRGPEFYDYDSLLIILKSPCDDDIADSVYISARFIPTCTQPLLFAPDDKWTLNNSFRDTLDVVIAGYDYNFGGLKNITFQYKESSSSTWRILETFKKTSLDTNDKLIPVIQPYIDYAWDMSQITDGPYDIKAVSNCRAPGYADAQLESPIFSGVADRINPSPFGSPSPADGILSPNDEISIQFNEPIDNASLSFANFDVRGVLNGSAAQKTASISFDGNNDYLEIPIGLNLNEKSFSLEFWARRGSLGEQIIFSQGSDPVRNFALGFDAANKLYFRIENNRVTANTAVTDTTTFFHYTVSYNYTLNTCELFMNGIVQNTGNTQLFASYRGGADKTYIGKSGYTSLYNFKGNLRDFRLWTKPRTSSEILSSINNNLKGTEPGILANWRCDEADGNEVKDYIRSRHATKFNAVWEINPKGKSFRINTEPLTVNAADLVYTRENDFTLEFWFKGANTTGVSTLFSNGRGDSTDSNPELKWSIEKDANGKIIVTHLNRRFEAVTTNFFDGNWHHFALVMQRATSLAAFVDGNQQNNTASTNFAEFGGDKFWIGARGFQPPAQPEVIDRKFNGYVDEFRLWNTAKNQEQIKRDRLFRLQGNEAGLIAYIPFELYTLNLGVPVLTANVSDILKPTRSILFTTALGSGTNAETPTINLPRPVEAINFNYAINNDKIIITPNTLPGLIENITLDVTVRNVKDLRGNTMQSPKTWIAYVDKNQVKWLEQDFTFEKKKGVSLTFNATIVNSGGAAKLFNIGNLPPWLTANITSGLISPNSSRVIQFTVNQNVNIGSYEEDVQVTTDFGFPDPLLVKLKVYTEAPSSWTVNTSNFTNSMNIVGQIRVNNIISTNPDDKLAAFVNGQCRGVANLQYFPQIDRYYAFLTVFSNVSSGEQLEFKIWNATEGKIHSDVTPQISFVTNAQLGTITTPQIFNASDKLTQYIPLSIGWNWVSFNLAMRDSNDINRLLSNVNLGSGAMLRSQTSFADYSPANGWVGELANPVAGVKPTISYRIRSNVRDTLMLSGIEIDPTTRPIRLDSGWNWIGFISQRNLSLAEAFSSLNATAGDLVKNQQQFAIYDPTIGWIGSLTALLPSSGYMFKSGNNNTFMYPKSAMFAKTGVKATTYESDYFKPNSARFDKNMSAVVEAGICQEALVSGRFSLGAYHNNELRGATAITPIPAKNKNLYFINFAANTENETITFRLLDEKTGETYLLNGSVDFATNKLMGNLNEPIKLEPTQQFDCNNFKTIAGQPLEVVVSPNPFSNNVSFEVKGASNATIGIKVYDICGKLVDEFTHAPIAQGNVWIDWSPAARGVNLNEGVYFIELTQGSTISRKKLIKQ